MAAGTFVGVGIDEYAAHPALTRAVADVVAFRELLGDAFTGDPLGNPTAGRARAHLESLVDSMPDGGPLVLMWCGHGIPSPADGLRLVAGDSRAHLAAGLGAASEVAAYCALSGANQILIVLDTCYSGAAVTGAGQVMAALVEQVPPEGRFVWVGVLASCLGVETARDGLFGRRLRRLLEHGPTMPELRLRWSVQNEFIRGEDLCDAVLKEWDSDEQRPDFQHRGSGWWMFRNPLYRPDAPERVVEHLLLAARGGAEAERSWFTGRTAEVDRVVAWVRAGEPGLYVVTGSAGTGKSAVVGRVVSLANPHERDRLLADDHRWTHDDPAAGSVHAHAHARGLTADGLAEIVADGLVRRGVLARQQDRRNAAELTGQLQRAVEAGAAPPTIVVDGLDEARGEAFTIARDLLLRLARHAVVVVATREVTGADGASLVGTLTAGAVLDLDDAGTQDSGRADLRSYVAARLAGVHPLMDPDAVAEAVAGGTSMTDSRPFLLARLITDQLRAVPVDTSAPAWQDRVSDSIEAAFEADLAGVEPPPGPSSLPAPELARRLLTALTWGFSAGFPRDEWLCVANAGPPAADAHPADAHPADAHRADAGPADAGRPADAELGRDVIDWVLDQLGRYVVQDGEAGVAVYRIAHQSLADLLRRPTAVTAEVPFEPDALPVALALLDRYHVLLAGGVPHDAPVYLWRYSMLHTVMAGPVALLRLRRLAEDTPDLRWQVATTVALSGFRYLNAGRYDDALPLMEEGVALFAEASRDEAGMRVALAGQLQALSQTYGRLGRRSDAVAPAEQAAEIVRELAATGPEHLPLLAAALSGLGARYDDVSRYDDAVAATEEAVRLYRRLADDDPTHLADLAETLSRLGRCTAASAGTTTACWRCGRACASTPSWTIRRTRSASPARW